MVDRDFFDLLLLIYQSNAAVISNGGHNQLGDLWQRELVVEGRD